MGVFRRSGLFFVRNVSLNVTFPAHISAPLNRPNRQRFFYNITVESFSSFSTIFVNEKISFVSKNCELALLEPPFWRLEGYVRASLKISRDRLSVGDN